MTITFSRSAVPHAVS